MPLIWTHLIPATLEGRAMHNVQNAMFAAAIAFSMGIKLDAIRTGLRTFDTTFFQAPGRMNVYDEHPFKVIFDYGHNAHAVAAMCDLAQRLDVQGRRIIVLSAPGDRRDEDITAIAETATGKFDHYICRRDDGLRGREPDEIPHMLAKVLKAKGVTDKQIEIIPDEQASIDHALRMGRHGDLILIFADALTRSWKQVIKFKPEGAQDKVAKVTTADSKPKPMNMSDGADDMVDLSTLASSGLILDERGVRFQRETDD
jgi:cyanophycin synthetase